MASKNRPDGYWTKARCKREAKNFNTKKEFRNHGKGAWNAACLNKWVDEICAHMTPERLPNGYWTKTRCRQEALKYSLRSDFKKKAGSTYLIANRNGWLDEICSHMKRVGNRKQRSVYTIKFEDGSVYVGLAYDPDKRLKTHLIKSKKIIEKAKKYRYTFTYTGFMAADLAADEEVKTIRGYIDSGAEVLNKNRGGALGGSELFWTYEECRRESRKHKTRISLKNKAPAAYRVIISEGWHHLFAHMVRERGNKRIWTKERCKEEAKKYNTRNEFAKNSRDAYGAAWREGWLDGICKHMRQEIKPKGYWTKEKCIREAKKFDTRSAFARGSSGAYTYAQKEGIIDQVCSHMREVKKPNGYWTKSRCRHEALQYKTKSEFRASSISAYRVAKKRGFFDEICSHMSRRSKRT